MNAFNLISCFYFNLSFSLYKKEKNLDLNFYLPIKVKNIESNRDQNKCEMYVFRFI